ncbi:MAG: IS1595 family transposase [Actinomycetota bacterium]
MDLPELIEKFGTEDKCVEALAQLRWPSGVTCPKCESTAIGTVKTRRLFQCNSCEYQFSVRVGTVLQDSKLPLWKWFLATLLLIEAKKGISANQLSRTLGVTTKTGWYLCHRIRAAMVDDGSQLAGVVEADETYIGGKASGFLNRQEAALLRYDNKATVIGAISRGGQFKARVVSDMTRQTVHGLLRATVSDHAEAIYTDSHRSYRGIGDHDTRHEYVDHSAEEWVRGEVHTNSVESVWSLLKRAVIGSYHQVSKKHLPAYLDEFSFRFNNRENPHKFRDTLQCLCASEVLTYEKLIA